MKYNRKKAYLIGSAIIAVLLTMICTAQLNRTEDELLEDESMHSASVTGDVSSVTLPGADDEPDGLDKNENPDSETITTWKDPPVIQEVNQELWEKYHGEIKTMTGESTTGEFTTGEFTTGGQSPGSTSGSTSGSADNGDSENVTRDTSPVTQLPRIICWGDSLTETSDGKTSYPDVLREITGTEVHNYGVHSETTRMIAMREGAVGVYTDEVIIPSECVPVKLSPYNSIGTKVMLLVYGDAGINPCSLRGINGELSRVNGELFFTRSEEGMSTVIPDSTRLVTYGRMDQKSDDIVILFTGTNDGLTGETASDLVKSQGMILDDLMTDKYVVIGLTYANDMKNVPKINALLEETYGDHYLDLYEYMMNFGLEDAGLVENVSDTEDLEAGRIPSSLRVDAVHGNKYFNRLLAEQVYRKLRQLGYMP